MSNLTPQQARFVGEYLVDLNATQAALRSGYSPRTAKQQGSRLLSNDDVAAAIAEAQKALSEKTGITVERVLHELWAIGTADPNELVQFRRTCCRYCWGENHLYQYTEGEMRTRREAHDTKADRSDAAAWDADGLFDEGGGIGYDRRRDPHPDCPECFGEGVGEAIFKDSRKASREARSLYAGVKVTKDGMTVNLHDKVAALQLVGRHLGMFTDKTEHSGPAGGPIQVVTGVPRAGD